MSLNLTHETWIQTSRINIWKVFKNHVENACCLSCLLYLQYRLLARLPTTYHLPPARLKQLVTEPSGGSCSGMSSHKIDVLNIPNFQIHANSGMICVSCRIKGQIFWMPAVLVFGIQLEWHLLTLEWHLLTRVQLAASALGQETSYSILYPAWLRNCLRTTSSYKMDCICIIL